VAQPPGSTARRPQNPRGEGGRLRAELLAAADRILARTGDEEGLSLRAVAREAGVTATSVYRHFPDKRALVRAVAEAHFAELRRALDAATAGLADPAERLRARCLAYCRFALEQPGSYRLLFGSQTPLTPEEPLPEQPGADTFFALVADIQACIETGAAAARDASAVAADLWPALHGIASLRRSVPGFPWKPLPAQVDALLAGLVGLPPRQQTPGGGAGSAGAQAVRAGATAADGGGPRVVGDRAGTG